MMLIMWTCLTSNGSDGCVGHMVATPLDVEASYLNSLGAKSPYAW
jgi:hypothetical protein